MVGATTPTSSRPPAWLLLVVFLAGAALMALELVGSRVLAPFFGNSIYVWGSLIGVFLAALSIGYAVGGKAADRYGSVGLLASILAAAALLTAASTVLSTPIQSAVVEWNPGLRLNPLVSAIAIFGIPSILMGMVSPFAVKLAAIDIEHVGSTAGSLYGLSTVGSIVGTVGTAFYLIGAVGTTTVIVLISLTLICCSYITALIAVSERRGGRSLAAAGVSLIGILGLILFGSSPELTLTQREGEEWSPVFKAGGYESQFSPSGVGKIRDTVDSTYHRIRVVDYQRGVESTTPVRVMHFDNSRQAAVSLKGGKDPDTSAPPVFDYLRAFDLVGAAQPEPKRALFIGLGAGTAPLRFRAQHPDAQIDVVEIDPAVVKSARKWFGYDDKKLAIDTHVGDGRSWLAAQNTQYDVIVIDAYFADSLPFHLATTEFLDVVDDRLAADGVVAANLIGAVTGPRSKLFRSMYRTYSKHFSSIATYPVPDNDGAVRLNKFINIELIAASQPLPAAGSEIQKLTDAGLNELLDPTLTHLIAARHNDPVSAEGVPVLTDEYAPVDSLISVDPDDA